MFCACPSEGLGALASESLDDLLKNLPIPKNYNLYYIE